MDVEQKTLAQQRRILGELLTRLEGDPPPSSHELHEIWERRARPFWRVQPRLYSALAEKCREVGENFLAIEVVEEALAWFHEEMPAAEHLRLVHLRALAYASVGAGERARDLIEELGVRRYESADALGLLARTHKDWFEAAREPAQRRAHLRQARDAYRHALAQTADSYLAINAAATSLLLWADAGRAANAGEAAEEKREAHELARRAQRLCEKEHLAARANDGTREVTNYWRHATLAESSLILGEIGAAREQYRAAGELGRHHRAELLTTRKQARLLLVAQGRETHEFDGCFPLPNVAIFTGHMIDLPGRAGVRFPEAAVGRVSEQIAATLEQYNVSIGYGSAACGADLLFLRALLERPGGEIHVVLPFGRRRFRRESVARVATQETWGAEFDRVLASAASVTELSDSPCWFEANAFAFGNRVAHGLAEHKAREYGDAPIALAVWDGQPFGERVGGTADCIRHWAARGRERVLISPRGDAVRQLPESAAAADAGAALPVGLGVLEADLDQSDSPTSGQVVEEIAGILCGEWDAPMERAGAGERAELEARRRFFVRAAETLAGYEPWIVHRWVDGPRFRLIFSDLAAAGNAARALRDDLGTASANLRLALHAGPVVRWRHPLMLEREEPAGIHLQKAARLAALSGAGQTYVSREYAALLEALPLEVDRHRLHCVYQGGATLGEPFGRQALYVLAP